MKKIIFVFLILLVLISSAISFGEYKNKDTIKFSKNKVNLNFYFLKLVSFNPNLIIRGLFNVKVDPENIEINNTNQDCNNILSSRCEENNLINYINKNPKPPCLDNELEKIDCTQQPIPSDYDLDCYRMGCSNVVTGALCKPLIKLSAAFNKKCFPSENPCTLLLIPEDAESKCCVPGKKESFNIDKNVAQGIIDMAKKIEKGDTEDVLVSIGGVCTATLTSKLGLEEKFDIMRRIRDMSKFGPITVGGSIDKPKITYNPPNCPNVKTTLEFSRDQIIVGCEIKF